MKISIDLTVDELKKLISMEEEEETPYQRYDKPYKKEYPFPFLNQFWD